MADGLLDRMRANPRDWRIEDVERLCRHESLACLPPRKESHYKVTGAGLAPILTIPAHRPIKPVYIRELVGLVDVVRGGKR